jgi:hypothetical protein
MKRLMVLMLGLGIALSCTVSAFSQDTQKKEGSTSKKGGKKGKTAKKTTEEKK